MKELKVTHLTKSHGAKMLFQQISFLIHEKDRIGLIGINGTGKTTLLAILAGQEKADDAFSAIDHPSHYRIGYLSQETEFSPDLRVLDAVFQGKSPTIAAIQLYEAALLALEKNGGDAASQRQYNQAEERMNQQDAWQADTRAKIILNQLGIDQLDQKMHTLSGGQKKRVALAQALIDAPDLLLLDEPTNHLDYETIRWLENDLLNYPGAILMVTHDRYFLDRVATRIFELSEGNLQEYAGNYEQYVQAKAQQQEQAKTQEMKQKRLYKQELAWMRAGVQARGTKQQARKDRFLTLQERVSQGEKATALTLETGSQRLGKKVLAIENGYFQMADQVILSDFSLLVQSRDRIGITGKNGAGKSTFLHLLAGKYPLDSGVYTLGETVRLAYYTQEIEAMDPEKRVIAYLQETAEEITLASQQTRSVSELLEQFLFPRAMHGTKIGKLSGGERRRLYLLKLLMQQPNVLLLDEPTNDLDIATLTVLEDYIRSFSGAVIAVSHDRYFLDKTMQKLLIFAGKGKIDTFYGAMSDYLSQIAEQKKTSKKSLPKEKITPKIQAQPKTKLTYMEQKEWERIEDEITQLEETCAALEAEMIAKGADFEQVQALQVTLAANEALLEEKMNRWEYLSAFVKEERE